jgi:histidinol-phosphate aminotransferase
MLSRRSFLGTLGTGAAAATAAGLPLIERVAAIGEPARGIPGFVLLNSNENAYGPSPRVAGIMRTALSRCNRYPDSEYDGLLDRIATLHRVSRKQVLLGHGSTEVLRMAADAFLAPERRLVTAVPTFEAMQYYATARGVENIRVPLTASFAHDLDAMLARAQGAGLIYICNPNNPTGSITPRTELEQFVAKLPATTMVLVDEAYHHFAAGAPQYASFIDHPIRDDRVVVARTFSKVYGLAGLRLGYAIGSEQTISKLRHYQLQDNANMVALACGVAALGDAESTHAAVARNAADRAEFVRQAEARRIRPIPSHTNFVMMPSPQPAPAVIDHFKRQRVLIGRPFPPLESYVRVSLGIPEEMRLFWRVWDSLPAPS